MGGFKVFFLVMAYLAGLMGGVQPAEPEKLTAAEVSEVFLSLDPDQAQISRYSWDHGELGRYAAGAAISAKNYAADLAGYPWEEIEPYPAWHDETGWDHWRLTAPGADAVFFTSLPNGCQALRLTTPEGEGWFQIPAEGGRMWGSDTLQLWYEETQAATRHKGDGVPLTADELAFFVDYTAFAEDRYDENGEYRGTWATPIACFFTSWYDAPRDLDPAEFLYYCPEHSHLIDNNEADEAEFRLVQKAAGWEGDYESLSHLPVPCHRYPRSYLDGILTQYAGLTVADMTADWKAELIYVPETDCFYGFASDFGPGVFLPRYGERSGDVVTLWGSGRGAEDAVLRLQSCQDGWRILSHQKDEP